MTEKKTYWRVEKWRTFVNDDGTKWEGLHRQTTFETLEEAQQYFDNASSIYRLKMYEVDDLLLSTREPYEEPWDDNAKSELRKTFAQWGQNYTDEEWSDLLKKVEEKTDVGD